jgi:AraC family transcriptional regulator of adaptative response/methylated-DNA-[protein]-cysteine methyltransferase
MTPRKTAAPEAASKIQSDPRWAKVRAKDRSFDGQFVYAVKTTGVYCRPSCPARPARPENLVIYDTSEQARAAGFRACRRCHPDGLSRDAEHAILVEKACRLIERRQTVPALAELAQAVELSPGYFHRLFKAATGLTPSDYAKARRAARVRQGLAKSASITEALYAAGFNSSGRFYEKSAAMLGMTPGKFRDGGGGEEIRFAVGECSLGSVLVAASGKGIAAILLGDDPGRLLENLQDSFPKATLVGADPEFETLVARVVGFIEAPAGRFDLPLDVRGTAFQQRVWKALNAIPPGYTVSYADIARSLDAPGSSRAVAGACAANKLAVAIPCHRVVRTDGALSGYRWGIERKAALLEREKARVGSSYPPLEGPIREGRNLRQQISGRGRNSNPKNVLIPV